MLPSFVVVALRGRSTSGSRACPAVAAVSYGLSPAVIALILHSCYRLIKLGVKEAKA